MEALRGTGEGESERWDVEQDAGVFASDRDAERRGEEEGEKVIRILRRGLDVEMLRKEGMVAGEDRVGPIR